MYMKSPEGVIVNGTYNASKGVLNIYTYIMPTLNYKFININKVELSNPEYPDQKPLVLIRKET